MNHSHQPAIFYLNAFDSHFAWNLWCESEEEPTCAYRHSIHYPHWSYTDRHVQSCPSLWNNYQLNKVWMVCKLMHAQYSPAVEWYVHILPRGLISLPPVPNGTPIDSCFCSTRPHLHHQLQWQLLHNKCQVIKITSAFTGNETIPFQMYFNIWENSCPFLSMKMVLTWSICHVLEINAHIIDPRCCSIRVLDTSKRQPLTLNLIVFHDRLLSVAIKLLLLRPGQWWEHIPTLPVFASIAVWKSCSTIQKGTGQSFSVSHYSLWYWKRTPQAPTDFASTICIIITVALAPRCHDSPWSPTSR